MGTRAAFFIGDARDLENREFLGTVAWDGYPDGDCSTLAKATSPEEFKQLLKELDAARAKDSNGSDFAGPEGGFPSPWTDDLFLTDFVYCFFNEATHFSCFGRDWVKLGEERYHDKPKDPSFKNVAAPGGYWDQSKPDSIMIIGEME